MDVFNPAHFWPVSSKIGQIGEPLRVGHRCLCRNISLDARIRLKFRVGSRFFLKRVSEAFLLHFNVFLYIKRKPLGLRRIKEEIRHFPTAKSRQNEG
jgi:hypothetical protein